jgi:hypothetical protein
MNLFECPGLQVLLDLLVLLRATVTGWSSFGFFFCKKGFEKSFPTNGAKLLEHSFPRMTWRILIRRVTGFVDDGVNGDDGVWVDLAAK